MLHMIFAKLLSLPLHLWELFLTASKEMGISVFQTSLQILHALLQ